MKKKINWLLILQGWAMLWVIIGHSPMEIPIPASAPLYAKILFNIAYSFHMPLFIAVSGYLFYLTRIAKPMAYKDMIIEKLQRFGIPFVVFTIVAMLLKSGCVSGINRPSAFNLSEFVNAFLFPYDGPMQELWFLAVIMWFFISKPLWEYILSSKLLTVLCAIVTFTFALFKPQFLNEFLCIPSALRYSFYFFLGMVAIKYNVIEKCYKYNVWILLSCFSLYVMLFCNTEDPRGVHFAILGICISTSFALILDKIAPSILKGFRNYTYQIYLMGIFFQIACKLFYSKFGLSYHFTFAFCILAGLYLPVIVSKIAEKRDWGGVMMCIGLKKH